MGPLGYGVVVFDFRPEFPIADRADDLDALIVETVPMGELTITDSEPTTIGDRPGVRFTGTELDTGGPVDGLAVIDGNRLYLVLAFRDPGSTVDPDRFLSSFTIG